MRYIITKEMRVNETMYSGMSKEQATETMEYIKSAHKEQGSEVLNYGKRVVCGDALKGEPEIVYTIEEQM